MILFLYGQDTYRSLQKLNEIIRHYKKLHKSGLNLRYFEGKELKFQDFKDEIQTVSMFKEKKLAILSNVFENERFKQDFLKNVKKFIDSQSVILFFEPREIAENDSLFKFLKKQAKSQEFKLLKPQELKNWIQKEFSKYQKTANPPVLEKLINFVGKDLWQMSNEIKKLVNYQKNQEIKIKDVELLVEPKIEIEIFKTIDAIASKNKKQALNFLHKHLKKGDSPLYLLAMMNFQFRNLLMIKSCGTGYEFNANYMRILSQKLGMHPFVVRKTFWQTKKFSLEELKKIYRKIFQADLDIKTGQIEPETALDLLITGI